nr:hypothetical protein [Tanacetum cinerariifolium]
MEAEATTTMTTKLLILNLGEYDLWLMSIELEQTYEPTTAEEKKDRRNKMKARGTLLMALPNKDQLKLLMEAIEKMYGGNKESKKVQRTLLKQQYENFVASSLETLDQTFDRLQKLISQLELQGEDHQTQIKNLQNMAFVSSKSTSSTNEANTTASGVSTAHTQGTTVNSTSVDNLRDVMICAFLASQPNTP